MKVLTVRQIDAILLRKMFLIGAKSLEANKQAVDALNVFPVPDGDTGTNMHLTLQAVVRALDKPDLNTCAAVAQVVASGSLMGARGNSGVILSQLFRGFARSLDRKTALQASDFAIALMAGVETAYKAVGRPVEGTILTVARDAARTAQARARTELDLIQLMQAVIEQAEKTLSRTPEMLPVLKKAGVVDAGGQGLVHIYRGFLLALQGKELEPQVFLEAPSIVPEPARPHFSAQEIEFQYCTEFLILNPRIEDHLLRPSLESHGDSLLVVGDEGVIKVHIHTNHPGTVMELALEHGELSGIKIENMREQHAHTQWAEEGLKAARPGSGKSIGVVVVSAGKGLSEIFMSLGADVVVEGGQTMNPSTEDLAAAVNSLACDRAIILPNNKNVILAASQVKEVTSKEVAVVTSRSVPQGLMAMLSYEADALELERVSRAMHRRMNGVKTGLVTYAVKKSYVGDVGEIEEGDILGLNDKDISTKGTDISEVALTLLSGLVTDDDGVISLFYGADTEEASAKSLAERIMARFPNCEVEFFNGGQPLYYYIFSVE